MHAIAVAVTLNDIEAATSALDEDQFVTWVEQAGNLPGEKI
jgi:hypothetical protein